MSHPYATHLTSIFKRSVISATPSMMTAKSNGQHWSAPGSTMPTAFSTVSRSNINKLQSVQNALAHVELRTYHRTDAAPLLVKQYWLPIERGILFKLATSTFTGKGMMMIISKINITLKIKHIITLKVLIFFRLFFRSDVWHHRWTFADQHTQIKPC